MAEPTNAPNIKIVIHGSFAGFPLDIEFFGRLDQLGPAVDKLRQCGIRPAGTDAPAKAPTPPEAPTEAPAHPMASDGRTPLCVYHNATMTEGHHGWYCQRKGTSPETSNSKGFCTYGVRYDRVPRAK